ncbi:MAG: hypothetical protein J2P21_26695 [Chloracidobacterium sp.]|nr:hypothetical protein [Chloracidobacterium sp.]
MRRRAIRALELCHALTLIVLRYLSVPASMSAVAPNWYEQPPDVPNALCDGIDGRRELTR